MRWKLSPEESTRFRRAFLLLPKTINRECRWLEIAEWREDLELSTKGGCTRWTPRAWVDAG